MNRRVAFAAVLAVQFAAAAGNQPLTGTWRLEQQEINGSATKTEPLTLKISQAGDKVAFAFSVPVNDVYFVSMSYTLRLDGSEADVKNAQGETVGHIQMSTAGTAQYKFFLKGPNRPDSTGKLTVSPDGKTLISETDAVQGGRSIHTKQTFSRY